MGVVYACRRRSQREDAEDADWSDEDAPELSESEEALSEGESLPS